MTKRSPFVCAALLASATIAGIGHAQNSPDPSSMSSMGAVGAVARPDADNSGLNQRDRGSSSKTPLTQSENRRDIKLLAAVRKAIVRDKSLSTDAHNLKVMTQSGMVTLRGPVHGDAEHQTIVSLVEQVPGVTQVQDQLDIKQP